MFGGGRNRVEQRRKKKAGGLGRGGQLPSFGTGGVGKRFPGRERRGWGGLQLEVRENAHILRGERNKKTSGVVEEKRERVATWCSVGIITTIERRGKGKRSSGKTIDTSDWADGNIFLRYRGKLGEEDRKCSDRRFRWGCWAKAKGQDHA